MVFYRRDNYAGGVCCCIVFFACAGPILLIVGAVFLASPDTRGADVDAYNAQIALYNSAPSALTSAAFLAWASSGSTNTAQIQLAKSDVPPVLDDAPKGSESWTPYTSVVHSGDNVIAFSRLFNTAELFGLKLSTGAANVSLSSAASVSPFTVSNYNLGTSCRDRTCSRCRNSNGNYYDCNCRSPTSSEITSCETNKCNAVGGQYNSGSRDCTLYRRLTAVCVRLDSQWRLATTFGSSDRGGCVYDRDSATLSPFSYSSATSGTTYDFSSVTVSVRDANDPFAWVSLRTKGDLDFGLSKAEKNAIGAGLLGAGVAVIALEILVIFLIYKCCASMMGWDQNRSAMTTNTYVAQPSAVPMATVAQPTQPVLMGQQPMPMAQPMYAQQPMQQLAQPMYGQQPMAQPMAQPMYGQQQPMMMGGQPPAYTAY